MISNILYIIYALLAFSVLVIVHELGHFTLAKLNNVFVEEFAIGMGPKIFSFKGKETRYSLRMLPIGGYVKMLGENDDNHEPRSFNVKSNLQKLSIIAAGPIMNFLIAIGAFVIVLMSVGGYTTTEINEVMSGSPAETAGLKNGDIITKVDGKNVKYMEELQEELFTSKGKTVEVEYKRGEKTDKVTLTPEYNEETRSYQIGFYPKVKDEISLPDAVKKSTHQVKYMSTLIFDFFKTLVTGKANLSDVGGPVSVVKVTVAQAKLGPLNLINFMGMISVQLAVFNILPLPALDGGYILLYLVQMITRKKIDEEKVGTVTNVGFVVLMGFMLFVTLKDIFFPINI